jgi:hypothetical protein
MFLTPAIAQSHIPFILVLPQAKHWVDDIFGCPDIDYTGWQRAGLWSWNAALVIISAFFNPSDG